MNKNLKCVVIAVAVLIFVGLWLHPHSIASSATAREFNALPLNSDVSSLYDKKCAECHGKDGRSKTFRGRHTHARDLTDAEWQARVSDERIYNSISSGKGKMPAFGKKLSEAEINSLATYVRNLKK